MTRSERLRPVQRLAEDRADAAAKAYGEAQQRLAAQRAKLTQLTGFRADYQSQRAASVAMDGFRLRDYNAFIARLDQAIGAQGAAIAEAEAEVERRRLQWLEVLGRARAIDKAVGRYRVEEVRAEEHRAQRHSDELAGRVRRPALDEEDAT